MTRDPWDPFRELESLLNQMSAFDQQSSLQLGGTSSHQRITVDVVEHDDEVEVLADLPGVAKENIDLRVQDQKLTLSVEQNSDWDDEDDDTRFVQRERHSMRHTRTVRLPSAVNAEEATAKYTNGVLTVTLPKRDGADGHAIEIDGE